MEAIGRWGVVGLVLLLGVMLGGCGKGGSTSAASGGGIVYSGATTPASIDSSNGGTVAGAGAGSSASTANVAAGVVMARRTSSGSAGSIARLLDRLLKGQAHEAPRGPMVAGAAYTKTVAGSVAGSKSYSGNLDATSHLGTVTVSYSQYDNGTAQIEGSASLQVKGYNAANDVLTDVTSTFDNLTYKSAADWFSMNGTIVDAINLNTSIETLIANYDMSDHFLGQSLRVQNLVMVLAFDNFLAPTTLGESVSGRVYLSSYGYVDIVTTTPLFYSTLTQDNPDSGGPITMTGASGSAVRLTPVDATHVLQEVDANGDGTFEFSQTVAWTSL